ncbi:MAG: ABC transporter substrate-binding protein [Anaerolineae bacterium]|jgi:peptide/nickel transport system substrate-binding protein
MTRHIIWQAILALLGIVLVFLILSQLTSSPITEEVPAAGGAYIEGILGYSERINPILAPLVIQANPVDQDLSALVFDGLTTLDAAGQVTPSLAIDWEVSEDGTVYEFHLRQDVDWHDGAPFTSADVAFTVQAMQDSNYQGATALRELWRNVTVEKSDEYTVRFILEEPFPSFLYYTTIGILPAHLLGNVPAADLPTHDFTTKHPVGTGMFMVERVSPNRVVLVANPDYWGPKPYLEQLEFWFFADWDGLLADYEQGAIHGFHPQGPEHLANLTQLSNLQLYSAPSAGYGIIYLNLQRETLPFLQEKDVRQALLYALDRQALIDEVLGGQGLVADSPMLPVSWAYDPSVPRYRHDPERAIGLLDASAWVDSDADRIRDKEDVPLAFNLLVSDDPTMTQMAERLAEQWRAVGIDVAVRPTNADFIPTFVRDRTFDAALIEVGLTADPDPYPLWHSTQAGESGQNFSGFANEEADLVMEEGRTTTDLARRAELYRTFQQIFAEEVPSILIYYPIYTYAIDTQVHQVQLPPLLHTSDRFRNIHEWYMETKEIVVDEKE